MRRGDSGNSSTLNRVPEDEEPVSENVDWELEDELLLEEQGFYQGSYKRLVAFYTLAPLTALAAFVLLALLPYVAYRWPKSHPPTYPYLASLPFPLPEILASVALYSLAHLLRSPIYALSAALIPFPLPATLLSTALHTILSTVARLFTLALLLVQHHGTRVNKIEGARRPDCLGVDVVDGEVYIGMRVSCGDWDLEGISCKRGSDKWRNDSHRCPAHGRQRGGNYGPRP